MFYVKATTTSGLLVSLKVINATLHLTKPVAKKLQGVKKLFLSGLDAISITSYM